MKDFKVCIRGAGDLATGIGLRMYNSGFNIVMTDIEIPTTVRRTVAFSRAVYEKSAVVEGVEAVFCKSLDDIKKAHSEEKIAVIVDLDKKIQKEYAPDIIIDAIIAKKNIGTSIDEARVVVAVGPGFVVGKDCMAVVETKRGHSLGKVILEGSAIPNTGIPGNIGGFTKERLISSECAGVFKSNAKIGDIVKKGDIVAYVDKTPVLAKIDGVVRGMLQDFIKVSKGFKLGDIDPRANIEHCFSISDKARAVGGGALEAVMYLLFRKKS
jgi:selenium-dependent molybdenum hydroxylase system protein, yqeB family